MGDVFDITDPTTELTRLTGMILDPGATPGDVLTVQSDGSVEAAPGGGAVPITRELLEGNAVSIDDGNTAPLTWDTKDGGTTLLDLTNPAAPAVITSGTYAVSVTVIGSSLSVDGFFRVNLEMDANNDQAQTYADSRLATAAQASPRASVSSTYYIPAGDTIDVRVTCEDGSATRDFNLASAVVQRLS